MRRTLLSLVVMVLCTVLPLSAAIRFDMDSVSFEGGQIPADWAADGWVVEGGAGTSLVDPTGCAHGLYRVAARSESSVEGVRASLITKAVDFVAAESDEPRLVFSYAAPVYYDAEAGVTYVDTLVVYYQAAANGQWTELGTFGRTPGWKMEEIILPNYMSSRAYRIKFEMRHCIGSSKGVVLDNVFIYQSPKCEAPTIAKPEAWMDSLYVEFTGHPGGYVPSVFEAFLSKTKNNKPDTITDFSVYAPYYVQEQYENYLEWSGLSPYTQYYLYARTNCDDNLSGLTDWSEMPFRTPKLIYLPYVENFDSAAAFDGWYRLASQGLNGVPAVVNGVSDLSLKGNKCLFFGSSTTTSSTLAAGQYACAVSPQIVASSLKDVQVSFWGAAGKFVPGANAPQLEVGVITDPEDIKTFVPVATVKMDAAKQFKKFVVNFSSYTGKARYIAFRAVGADLENQFAIDDLKFEALATPVPSIPELKAITPSSLTVEVNKFGADAWNLMLAENYYHDSIPAALISQNAISATTATIALPDSLQGKVVTIYAQGIKGGVAGEWSFPLTVRVPLQLADTTPQTFTFSSAMPTYNVWSLVNENKAATSLTSPALAHFALHNTDYRPQISSNTLSLPKKENYFALGYLDNLSDKEIIFHLRGNSSNAGKVALGVMTNPYDESTFELLAEFDGEKSGSEYSECMYDLDQYTGAGHYLAFKSLAAANYIQSIILDTIPTCRKVVVVNCIPGSTKASLSWEANNMSKWQIVVSKSASFADTVANVIVTTPSCILTDLEQEKTYYYKVNTICGGDTIQMYSKKLFKTAQGLPFRVVMSGSTFPTNLTKMTGLASAAFAGTLPTSSSSGWTTQLASAAPGGMGDHVKLNIWGGSCNYWMVSPNLAIETEPGLQVRLTFDAAWTKYGQTIAPTETSTDDKFMVLISQDGGASWKQSDAFIWANDGTGNMGLVDDISNVAQQIALDLTAYAGKTIMVAFYGESTVSGGDNDFHVANIKLATFDPNCPGLTSLSVLGVTENSATLDWLTAGTQEVTIQVAKSTSFADSTIVYNQTVTSTPVVISDLEGNTRYYVRAVQTCDPNHFAIAAAFKTDCSPYTVDQFGVVNFSEPGVLDCWKVGLDSIGTGMSAANYSSYEPQVKSVSRFGKVLNINKQLNTTSINYGNNYYAILPELDVDTINKYQLTFSAGAPLSGYSTNLHSLVIGVSVDGTIDAVSIDTINIAAASDSTQLKKYVISFDNYHGNEFGEFGRYVVLMASADGEHSNNIYLDNFFFEPASGCHQVIDLDAIDVVDTAAVLDWSSKVAEQFELVVSDTLYAGVESSSDVFYRAVVNQSIDTIVGLEGLKTYYAFVRAICAEGDTSVWSPATTFTTECASVSAFPWIQTFDSLSTGAVNIECWTNEHLEGTGTGLFNVTATALGGNSTKYLQLPDQQTGNITHLELPLMNISEADAYEFRFDMYRSNYSSIKYNEGFVITAEGSFGIDTLAIVPRQYTLGNDYVEAVDVVGWYKYAFPIRHAGNLHIHIYGISEYGMASSADNLEVRLIPTCPMPKRFKAAALSCDTALLVWEGEAADYILELSDANDFSTLIDSVLVSDTAYVFRNLVSGVIYYARVRSNCEGGEWTESSFKTALSLPLIEDFQKSGSSIPDGWSRYSGDIYNSSVSSTTSGWTFTSTAGAGMTAYHAYCSAYYSTTTTYKYALVTPAVVLNSKAGNIVKLSFDLALTSSYSGTTAPSASVCQGRHFSVAVVTDSAVVPVMVWADTLATEGSYSDIPRSATSFEADLTAFAGQKVALAFFHSIGTSTSTSYSYISLDNIKLQQVNLNCLAPVISAKDATSDSLSVLIANAGTNSYMLEISASDKFATVLDTVVVSDSVAGFGGLTPATYYYVRARKLCGDGEESSVSDVVYAMTECLAAPVPYALDLSKLTKENIPLCWTKVQASGNYPYVSTSGYIYMYGGTSTSEQIIATPEFAEPVNKLTLNLNYKNLYDGAAYSKLIVGTYSDLDSAFVPLDTLNKVTAQTNVELILSAAPANAKYIAFRLAGGTSSNYAYIYSMSVSKTPACPSLKSVKISNVARREFDINWEPKVAVTAYDLVISTTALSDAQLELATPIVVDTTFYHATGLTRGTQYYVYVRANCGVDDGASVWSSAKVKTKALQAEDVLEVAPEEGTSSTYVPYAGWYHNSYVQAIYTASDLADYGATTINSIALNYYNATSMTRRVSVFMANIDANQLGSDYLRNADLVEVYSEKPYTFSSENGEWNLLELDEPFEYSGGNLLVAFYMNYDACETFYASGARFYTHSAASMTRYQYSDTQTAGTIALTNGVPTATGTASSYRPNIQFMASYSTPACPAVGDLGYSNLTASSATINWTAPDADYLGSYEVLLSDSIVTDFSAVNPQYVGIDSLSLPLTGLAESTNYYVYVHAVCNAEGHDDGISSWNMVSFKTKADCNALENVVAAATGKTTALVNWDRSAQGDNYCYILSLEEIAVEDLDAMAKTAEHLTDTFAVISGLELDTTYYVYVANECGAGAYSPFEMASFHTSLSCPAVANLHTETVAFNAVQLAWNHGLFGEETEWEVGLVGHEAQAQIISDSTTLIIGLNPETNYIAYVKPICSETESGVAATVAFTTPAHTGEVQIGDGGTTTTTSMPTNAYFRYSTSEQIYLASEIQSSGTVLSISFLVTDDKTQTRNLKVYLKHVTKSVFASTAASEWIVVDDADLVYDDEYTFTPEDWNTIEVSGFEYNGVDNLLVVVDDNTGSYCTSGDQPSFATYSCGTAQAFYKNSDSDNLDPTAPAFIGAPLSSKNQIKIGFETASCAKVANLKAENVTTSSALVLWFPGGSETTWNTFLSSTELTDAELAVAAFDTTSNYTKQLSGLDYDTDYYFYVRAFCSATERGDWKMLHFVTNPICSAPTKLDIDTLTANSVTLKWSPIAVGTASNFVVAYGLASSFDLADESTYQTMQVSDTFAVVSGLQATTTYRFAVHAICGADGDSRWSETIDAMTDCGAISEFPHFEGFDDPAMWDNFGTTYNYPLCWITTGYNNSTTYTPRIQANTASYRYAASDTAALYIYSSSSYASTWPSLVVSPEIVGNLDTLVLKFKMRACYQSVSTGNVSSGYYSSSYAKSIKVGTMSALNLNALTHKATFTLSGNYTSGDALNAANDYAWEEFELPLAGITDPYIALYSDFGDKSNYVWIDDIRIEPLPDCVRPVVELDTVTISSAKLRFESGADSWNAYLLEGADTVATYTALEHDTLTISGLSGATTYTFFVQGVCGTDASEWGKMVFTTECGIVTAFPWAEDFEAYPSGDFLANCFVNVPVEAGTGSGSSGKLFAVSTTTNGSNTTHQLQLPDQSAGTITRLYLPEMKFDTASLYNFSFDIYRNTSLYPDEGIRLFVKNVETGVESEIAFISRNYTVSDALVPAETASDWYNYEFPMPNDGHVYSIVLQGESQWGSSTYMDNLAVVAINPNCQGVDSLTATNITTAAADIDFKYLAGAHNAVVEVSKKADFSTIVYSETLTGDSACHISGLDAATNYYVRVKQLCGGDDESAYSMISFMTAIGAPFTADFSNGIPADWKRYSYLVTDAKPQFATADFSTTSSGWSKANADTIIASDHIRGEIWSTSFKYWLVTPAISLADNQGQGLKLTVDLGLVPYSDYYRAQRNTGTDDRFMIVISEDGGLTWNTAKNATIWDNNEDNHLAGISQSYNDIPEHAATYTIQMTDYVGKTIAIGFYGESTQSNADNYLHFGNIKLDTVPTTPVFDTICSGSDYAGYGFEVMAEDLKLGENLFSKYTPAEDSLHTDSITSLHLYVKLTPKAQEVNDTLCYGDSYTMPTGETIIATQSRRYNFTLSHAAANGCDSVMTINLFVHEKLDTTFTVLQCKGTPYEYKGKQYLTNTVIYDTVPSMVTGCDSTVTIIVEFSETELEQTSHRELIGPNTTYSDDLFTELSATGTYTAQTTSIYGCDSIVTLHLLVAQDEGLSNIYDTIYVDELPYILNGEELLPEGTTVGRHRAEIMVGFTPFYVVVQVVDRPVVGLEFILGDESKSVRKVMIDQHIYLIVGDEWYDTTGKHVEPVIK